MFDISIKQVNIFTHVMKAIKAERQEEEGTNSSLWKGVTSSGPLRYSCTHCADLVKMSCINGSNVVGYSINVHMQC